MVAWSITSKHSAERFQICSFYCNHMPLVEISAVVEFLIGLRKFRLVSADARGGGTRDEFLRESVWEANLLWHCND